MKKLAFAALAATAAIVATPAMAQSANATGSVQVTGSVASKCDAGAGITGTITLNELAGADGKVINGFTNNSGGLSRSFSIRCTSANVSIGVKATALTAQTAGAASLNGYTGTVHYTSTLTAKKAGGGADASAAYTTADSPPAETVTPLGDRLANATNNVTVTVSNGTTTASSDMLKADTSYTGAITITVSPI